MQYLLAAKQSVVVSLFSQMDPVGIGITILLLVISIYSWAVILERVFFFRGIERRFWEFERVFRGSRNLAEVGRGLKGVKPSPLSRLFDRGYSVLRESFEVLKVGRHAAAG